MAEDLTRKEAHAAVGSIAAAAQNKHAGSGAGATSCVGSGGRSGGGSRRKQAAVGELTPGTGTPGRRKRRRRDFASSIACSARMSQLYAQHSGGAMASLDRRPKQCVRLMAEALQGWVDCARRDIKSFCSLIFVPTTKKQASQHQQHHHHHHHQHQQHHQHHYQQQHQITPAASPHNQLGIKQLHGSKGGRRRGS